MTAASPSPAATPGVLPRHVAIIMDGNGRWARSRGLRRLKGHDRGQHAARDTVLAAVDAGIPNLTLFAFSNDNWKRERDEVLGLIKLLEAGLAEHLPEFIEHGVRTRFIGDRGRFSRRLRARLDSFEEQTSGCDRLQLLIALDYTGCQDVLAAVDRLAATGHDLSTVTAADIDRHLATAGFPHPDLVIRTSGERRLSNFMLWQAAGAEFISMDILWPDFGKEGLHDALDEFAARQARAAAPVPAGAHLVPVPPPLPPSAPTPGHVAIIIDGCARWARSRDLEPAAGHRTGVAAVQATWAACLAAGVSCVTLAAGAPSYWDRPDREVRPVLDLLLAGLQGQLPDLAAHGVRVRFIGDLGRFAPAVRDGCRALEDATAAHGRLLVQVALNYSGHEDIAAAVRAVGAAGKRRRRLAKADIDAHLATSGTPKPELVIFTAGERRLPDFMMWQDPYAEFHFTDTLWPDFGAAALEAALAEFAGRERRYGGSGA